MKPAVDYLNRFAEYAKLGGGYIPVAGPYIQAFVTVGQTIMVHVLSFFSGIFMLFFQYSLYSTFVI